MQQSEIDANAASIKDSAKLGMAFQDTLKQSVPYFAQYGDAGDKQHLSNLMTMQQRYEEASMSSDPDTRAEAAVQMGALQEHLMTYIGGVQSRDQEKQDEVLALRGKMRDNYEARLNGFSDQALAAQTTRDTTIEFINAQDSRGNQLITDPAALSAVRGLAGASLRDMGADAVSASIGIPFIGSFSKDFNDHKWTYDQAIKLANAFARGQTTAVTKASAATIEQMQQQGFVPQATEKGGVSVNDVNALRIESFRNISGTVPTSAAPPAPQPDRAAPGTKFSTENLPSTGRVIGESVRAGFGKAVDNAGDFFGGIFGTDAEKKGAEQAKEGEAFVRQYSGKIDRSRQRRPTN
jgi:hypothetical protein